MRIVKIVLICLAVVFALIQFVRIDKSNPPVEPEKTMEGGHKRAAGHTADNGAIVQRLSFKQNGLPVVFERRPGFVVAAESYH
jgi:hypothetical protein